MNNLIKKYYLTVILILLVSYCVSGCSSNEDKKNALYDELKIVAKNINNDFAKIREEVNQLASYTEKLYDSENQKNTLKNVNKSKYKLAENGVLYKSTDDGNSAVFVSGYIPVTEEIKNIVYFTEPLDSTFKNIIKSYPEVVQAYYNDQYSYNRIYPYFDVLTQYEPKMNIPSFNFYYLANEKYNPEKKAVWVKEPYVDPAGRGWMVSAIAPVYVDKKLEGVPGLDVTIFTITNRYLSKQNDSFIILDANGVIVSINDTLTGLFSLPQLEDHTYLETIKKDTYRVDSFNLLKSKSPDVRKTIESIYKQNKKEVVLIKGTEKATILAEQIPELDWYILLVIKD